MIKMTGNEDYLMIHEIKVHLALLAISKYQGLRAKKSTFLIPWIALAYSVRGQNSRQNRRQNRRQNWRRKESRQKKSYLRYHLLTPDISVFQALL